MSQDQESADSFSVDALLPAEWSTDLRNALDRWRQGDLIVRPVFTWAGPADPDDVTSAGAGSYDWEPIADPTLVAPYGIVVSQTCDIAASGPGRRHPFVDIAPVVRLPANPGQQGQIRRYEVMHLVALPAPPEPGFWVADLRLVIPVSKRLLAATTSIDAFGGDEAAILSFAEAVARKYRRPALHGAISETLPRSLNDYIDEVGKTAKPDWLEKVEQVRIAVTGDRLAPTAAHPYVIERDKLEAKERELWQAWRNRAKKPLSREGIELKPILFRDLDLLSARLYAASMPVNVKALGRPPAW
jgi:hypothetical protein